MSPRRELRDTRRRLAREWLVALSAYALLVAPFGCQLHSDLADGNTELDYDSVGLFINSDTTSNLILAGRGADGNEFFVYGTRLADGTLDEISSFLVRTAAGETSSIIFDDGWPVYAEGPDGSYVAVTYEQLTSTRLVGTATIYDAARDVTETYDIDLNLQLSSTAVAEAIEAATGQKLSVPSTGKLLNSAQIISIDDAIYAVFVTPVIFMAHLSIVVMGQVMTAVYSSLSAVMQVAILGALTPVFLIASILDEVLLRVEYTPLIEIFIELPSAPQV